MKPTHKETKGDNPSSSTQNPREGGPPRARELKKEFEEMVDAYVKSNPTLGKRQHELEISFGTTRQSRAITKMDYDNVVKQLYSAGFTTENTRGVHMLRIKEEYVDSRTGETRISNTRAEIMGIDLIQEYCKTNSLQKIQDMPSTLFAENEKLKFTQKTSVYKENKEPIRPVNFPEFSFNVKYQIERDLPLESPVVKTMIDKWTDRRKIFRHMNRVQFRHPHIPVAVDLSILRSSRTVGRTQMPEYTIQDAGVYTNEETYEIELELINAEIGSGKPFHTTEKVMKALRKCIRLVLSAIQGTAYPIGKTEQTDILQEYIKTVHGETVELRRINPKYFAGPSSVTLRLENVAPIPTDPLATKSAVPNIRQHYCVTDKADGDRKLLYIANNLRIYLIDTNMNVQFTGMITAKKELAQTLLDGEHILYDKYGKFLNLYAAFDVYFIRGKSVREFAFIRTDPELADTKFRLPLLWKCVEWMRPQPIVEDRPDPATTECTDFQIKCKQFYVADESFSIFDGCAKILQESVFEYTTDGLIFTPNDFGVAGEAVGRTGSLFKPRWVHSFKWKPAEFNTIDFLVSSSLEVDGKEEIHTLLQTGMELTRAELISQYKVIVLRCGFSLKAHGYLNPFQDVIDGNLPVPSEDGKDADYFPAPFQPTQPFDPKAHVCNVMLIRDGTGRLHMQTEEGEYFEEGMIVEFKYDLAKSGGWRWVPLRVRYDKTAELRSGSRNYGNAYDVANSNWNSIHNPITAEMMTTGKSIPEYQGDEDVYYNNQKTEGFDTKALKDFHNLYVKRRLIMGASKRKDSLIDFAVGKAGDLSKWVSAHLSFVLGIDVSRDNIQNKKDGACARYLTTRRKFPDAMDAIFLQGNSGLNIRSGEAFLTDKERKIARALFGNGAKDRKTLESGVYPYHGIGQDGFQVSSCQFALHYFFENAKTLHSFVRNVAECTALGGYFIGSCYDGKKVFQLLRDKLYGESFLLKHGEYKVFEIIKMYDETGFPEDELSLGYAIHVYQESIQQTIREYLVNFDYFVRIMGDYGFMPVPKHEAEKMGLPIGIGSFEQLFANMELELRRTKGEEYGDAGQMTEDEKVISFLNKYFVFRKMNTVNTSKIAKLFETEEERAIQAEEEGEPEIESMTKRAKRGRREGQKDAELPAKSTERPFLRRLSTPAKFIISDYLPPAELDTPAEIEARKPATPPPTKTDEWLEPEILPTTAPAIVRGDVKRVIRVPKQKITIL